MIEVGQMLAGKYRVERVLGQGGMGFVVSALHVELGQRVAVKFLMPELCKDAEPVKRFLREARAAVRIQNEHVARVLDVGKLENGAPYMVMEYLEGWDLAEEIDRRVCLPIEQAVDFLLQAAEAIAEAHTLGIVHRDLKPANLFLTRRPDGSPLIKVLDFGISKAMVNEQGHAAVSLTATQALLGSPSYMSPEQVRKPKTVDVRTDVWALGVILFELLVGYSPFFGDTPIAMLAAVVSDPIPSMRDQRPEIPEGLAAVVERCLAKDPNQRFQSVGELAEALTPFAPVISVPSITRISGMLRASAKAGPAVETLSVEGDPLHPVRADADTLQATPQSFPEAAIPLALRHAKDSGSAEAASGQRGPGVHTAAEWGGSTKPSAGKSRMGLLLALAVGVVGVLAGGAIAVSRSVSERKPDREILPDGAARTSASTGTAMPSLVPSQISPVLARDASTPTSAASEAHASAAHSASPPSHDPRRASGRAHVERPKSSASAAPPAPSASGVLRPHPLEGRR